MQGRFADARLKLQLANATCRAHAEITQLALPAHRPPRPVVWGPERDEGPGWLLLQGARSGSRIAADPSTPPRRSSPSPPLIEGQGAMGAPAEDKKPPKSRLLMRTTLPASHPCLPGAPAARLDRRQPR